MERRRGWVELPDDLLPVPEGYRGRRRKRRPVAGRQRPGGGAGWLVAGGSYAAFRRGSRVQGGADCALRDTADGPDVFPLSGVEWADWSRDGRLLAATDEGHLQLRDETGRIVLWELDLTPMRPDPRAAPWEADQWQADRWRAEPDAAEGGAE